MAAWQHAVVTLSSGDINDPSTSSAASSPQLPIGFSVISQTISPEPTDYELSDTGRCISALHCVRDYDIYVHEL